MEKAATQNQSNAKDNDQNFVFVTPLPAEESFLGDFIRDYLLKPSLMTSLTYLNMFMVYIFAATLLAGHTLSIWYALTYFALVYVVYSKRNAWKEKERMKNAHRIPFFADALANSLAVGCTLEQAFQQSIYYLRGELKAAFEKVMAQNAYGKEIGVLLRDLDRRFPKTGLKYLISLLEEYRELGIGISPLLKKMGEALKVKEGAEEKIRTILAGGGTYARLSIGIFGLTFLMFSFLLKDQITMLLSPSLKPVLLFLVGWSCLGMFIVTRITSLDFANHCALRPYVKSFMKNNQWNTANLLSYSGMHRRLYRWMKIALYSPLIVGFIVAYVLSWHNGDSIIIGIGFLVGVLLARLGIEFYLKGLAEDQMIKAVEIFPDFLQVYIIGLNSGLNSFISFQFAVRAIENEAPEVLRRELTHTLGSIDCGEHHAKAWQRLADRLPFETFIDFCEIMIISPLHGESIVKSITQMMTSYQSKKLSFVEKKANALGQFVIPIIVLAFFPLFLFSVFGPLWVKISILFGK